MKCLQLLLCWCSSILTVASCVGVDGYSCKSDCWNTITCVFNISANPMEKSNYSLKFISKEENFSCPLVLMDHSYSGACKSSQTIFDDYAEYDIKLCHESGCQLVEEYFWPSDNTQLTPPHEPEVQQTPKTINITWKSGYEDHRYLANCLKYELLLETSKESKPLHPETKEKAMSFQRPPLKPGATYCIKVRSMPSHRDYDDSATWSEWGPSKCWKTEAGEGTSSEQDNILVILTKSLVPICVAVGVLLFVFYSPAARMKMKTLSHTPSPAPFFQPLYSQHDGNLQEWLSPKGKLVLTYKTEEVLTTDAVIVVPKPITKDPEENQDFHNPSVPQLVFNQCQTSYVGLPGMHQVSPPLTMVFPGDMSYTQLPCPVWGVDFGGAEDVSSALPEDFLNISHADSGCNCEDLTQSPECSLPSSPVDDSPQPRNCNDYCILNKTADGFAPVLVSKVSSQNVPSDSLQEDKSLK